MTGRLWRAVLAVTLLAAGLGAPAARGAAGGAPCEQVGVSPEFGSDGRALCVLTLRDRNPLVPPRGFVVSSTTNGGRSWQQRRGSGLVPGEFLSGYVQVHFSPAYAADGEVYVDLAGSGRYVSTDLGDTWTRVADLGGLDMAPFRAPVTVPGREQPERWVGAFALGGHGAICTTARGGTEDHCLGAHALLVARRHVPVSGAQDSTFQFLVPRSFPADPPLSLTVDYPQPGEDRGPRYLLHACSVAFHCDERLSAWRDGWDVERAWLSPSFATDRTVWALAYTTDGLVLQRSTDGGRRFATLTTATRLLREGGRQPSAVVLTPDPRAARRVWLRVSSGFTRESASAVELRSGGNEATPPAAPGEQLFLSTDAGTSWRRVAHGLAWRQRGKAGALPFTGPPTGMGPPSLVTAGTKLFTTGRVDTRDATTYVGVFCSLDGGRSWARDCPR